jgi:predicted lipid-binding transport protein (Tim44 family)
MSTNDDRMWGRLQGGLLKGIVGGAVAGAVIGAVIGVIVFNGLGAIVGAIVAGVVGLGGLGAFWGVLSRLESPDPGQEPSQVERPLDVPELVSEQRNRREPR